LPMVKNVDQILRGEFYQSGSFETTSIQQ